MSQTIKICGLSTVETLDVALANGADLVGFVRFEKSPRHVSLDQAAQLAARTRGRAKSVVLTVDADDASLDEIVRTIAPDMLQLHGSETPARIAAIRNRYGLPVIKAIGIASEDDLAAIAAHRAVADILLIDAKPPKGADLPGGNGLPFDWNLLQKLDPNLPLMLSGGLTPANVAEAIRTTHIRAIDVSSGIEQARGVKDEQKIKDFITQARRAWKGTGI